MAHVNKMLGQVKEAEADVIDDEGADINNLQKMAKEEVVIQMVNLIISQAVNDRASDIHIEPFEREVRVRYRIDGVLHEQSPPPRRYHAAILSRIKILSDLNIAERRLPQDGRMRIRHSGRQIDLRISTVPTVYGESAVMRILDKQTAMRGLTELGMDQDLFYQAPPSDLRTPRHRAGHRPDRIRKDDDSLRGAQRDLQRGEEDHHG